MNDFLIYCLAKHGEGFNPKTCSDGAYARAVLSVSVARALASGKLNVDAQALAREYLKAKPAAVCFP